MIAPTRMGMTPQALRSLGSTIRNLDMSSVMDRMRRAPSAGGRQGGPDAPGGRQGSPEGLAAYRRMMEQQRAAAPPQMGGQLGAAQQVQAIPFYMAGGQQAQAQAMGMPGGGGQPGMTGITGLAALLGGGGGGGGQQMGGQQTISPQTMQQLQQMQLLALPEAERNEYMRLSAMTPQQRYADAINNMSPQERAQYNADTQQAARDPMIQRQYDAFQAGYGQAMDPNLVQAIQQFRQQQPGGASSAPATLPGFGAQPPMTQAGAMGQMGAPQGMMAAGQMGQAPAQMRNSFSAPFPSMALSSGNLATPAIMQRMGVADMMRNAGMMNQPAQQTMPQMPQPALPGGGLVGEQTFRPPLNFNFPTQNAGMMPDVSRFAKGGRVSMADMMKGYF